MAGQAEQALAGGQAAKSYQHNLGITLNYLAKYYEF
jgi:hypothetical protein